MKPSEVLKKRNGDFRGLCGCAEHELLAELCCEQLAENGDRSDICIDFDTLKQEFDPSGLEDHIFNSHMEHDHSIFTGEIDEYGELVYESHPHFFQDFHIRKGKLRDKLIAKLQNISAS
ncbi:hypothetical protein [Gimesia aquarii]|uniref:Uncharacterized protein n=1 Tax=Gimesia aquarii TaxID=2527964 RepID=A0A517VP17_9PLAN|nr:hypothetical protein [Gimesia aquarii]QDT94758.1 hypothetical protein V144x_01890 [Gimesia aquarii]